MRVRLSLKLKFTNSEYTNLLICYSNLSVTIPYLNSKDNIEFEQTCLYFLQKVSSNSCELQTWSSSLFKGDIRI